MKARTKLEILVSRLSSKVPPIDKKQKAWAADKCLTHLGYANKSRAFCLDCGEAFSLDLISRNRAICPHCGTRLKIKQTRATTYNEGAYFAIAHVVGQFQVVCNYEIQASYKKERKKDIRIKKILEYWISPEGKITKIGLLHHTMGCADSWCGSWEIRKEGRYYYNHGKYNIYPYAYSPDSIFKPEYKKIGINKNLQGLDVIEAIQFVPNNPMAETLLKAKQFGLLLRYHSESGRVSRCWPSIKICLRNGYKPKNASDWLDYIYLLESFGKDVRNAKYVCPKNLHKEHNRYVKKDRIRRERIELEEKRRSIENAEKEFSKRIKPFLGFQISDGQLVIKVLESVKEFEKEGDILKHCLFANGYYNKKDSLVLSARIDDKPIETIEVSLSKAKIVQARGFQNQPTEYHSKILKLAKKTLPAIKKIIHQKTA